ncbi:phage tail terminator-like protein [Phenylobacterium sp.]|uniref:phage tail terminator-like protein n=1 Tax=Phenylobacterium sp. TaxID=1871053 RepID=UPI0027333B0F|nr:phage tail terminator-like protein [Phenylobacterium sp.]MDP3855335.1 phage tail terminator-like protein [Phenylobacterium sp.]
MSIDAIRASLQIALDAIMPPIATAWEDVAFTPASGMPYQSMSIAFADPENNDSSAAYRQGGVMQVTLRYPTGVGPAAAEERAIAIRAAFPRGSTLTYGEVQTIVETTPAIVTAPTEGDRMVRIVRVRFYANDLI